MIPAQQAADANSAAPDRKKTALSSPAISGLWLFSLCLSLFLALVLLNHALEWRQGPFSWGAFSFTADLPWRLGPLIFIPIALGGRLFWQWRRGSLLWGSPRLFGPLVIFSLIAAIDIWQQRLPTVALALGLCWLIYLALTNQVGQPQRPFSPAILWAMLVVVMIQGTVSVAQFLLQQEVGLSWLGEPVLNPAVPGISVVSLDGTRWLRGYGINSHPNRLGLKMTMLLLLLWSQRHHFSRSGRLFFWTAMLAGAGGLLTSLSRSAWLALVSGGLVYLISWWRYGRRRTSLRLTWEGIIVALALMTCLLIFIVYYGDAVAGRFFRLDSSLESRSLIERTRDLDLAWQLLRANVWQGVGLGNLSSSAANLNPFAGIVHNIYLLIAVELGLWGLIAWLGFVLWPLLRTGLVRRFAPQTAVWVALLTVGMFQPDPLPLTMQGAALWGIAAALWNMPLQANHAADTTPVVTPDE